MLLSDRDLRDLDGTVGAHTVRYAERTWLLWERRPELRAYDVRPLVPWLLVLPFWWAWQWLTYYAYGSMVAWMDDMGMLKISESTYLVSSRIWRTFRPWPWTMRRRICDRHKKSFDWGYEAGERAGSIRVWEGLQAQVDAKRRRRG